MTVMEVEIETLLGQYRMQKVSGSHSEIEVGQRRESGRKEGVPSSLSNEEGGRR